MRSVALSKHSAVSSLTQPICNMPRNQRPDPPMRISVAGRLTTVYFIQLYLELFGFITPPSPRPQAQQAEGLLNFSRTDKQFGLRLTLLYFFAKRIITQFVLLLIVVLEGGRKGEVGQGRLLFNYVAVCIFVFHILLENDFSHVPSFVLHQQQPPTRLTNKIKKTHPLDCSHHHHRRRRRHCHRQWRSNSARARRQAASHKFVVCVFRKIKM